MSCQPLSTLADPNTAVRCVPGHDCVPASRPVRLRVAFQEYLRDKDESLGATARQKQDYVRHLARQLRLRGGLRLLDAMSAGGVSRPAAFGRRSAYRAHPFYRSGRFGSSCRRPAADDGAREVGRVPRAPGGTVMRVGLAILAAVLAVTTGGPLRCPCLLVRLFRTDPPAETRCYGCAKHRPTERTPAPDPPCRHGPGLDLISPPVGERPAAGDEPDAPADIGFDTGCVAAPAADAGTHAGVPRTRLASPPDRLRYCHAFRC